MWVDRAFQVRARAELLAAPPRASHERDDFPITHQMSLAFRGRLVTIIAPSAGWEVASEVSDEIDPRMPLFFLSYARSRLENAAVGPPIEPGRQVIQFFDDLSANVAELVSRRTGADPGFIDRSIPAGRRWSPELLTAVGNCQVFVALLSASYLECDFCGKEWDAFSRRKVTRVEADASAHEACIVPVIWAPIRGKKHPPTIAAIERFSPTGLRQPAIAANYEREGIFGLVQMGYMDDYRAVVWRLAQRISEICYGHRVSPRTFEYDDLRNVFREGAP